jgi:hypothetical protein
MVEHPMDMLTMAADIVKIATKTARRGTGQTKRRAIGRTKTGTGTKIVSATLKRAGIETKIGTGAQRQYNAPCSEMLCICMFWAGLAAALAHSTLPAADILALSAFIGSVHACTQSWLLLAGTTRGTSGRVSAPVSVAPHAVTLNAMTAIAHAIETVSAAAQLRVSVNARRRRHGASARQHQTAS